MLYPNLAQAMIVRSKDNNNAVRTIVLTALLSLVLKIIYSKGDL